MPPSLTTPSQSSPLARQFFALPAWDRTRQLRRGLATALRCALLALVFCWLSQPVVRQTHARFLVAQASPLLAVEGDAAARAKAEATLRKALELDPQQTEARRLLSQNWGSATRTETSASVSRPVTEDIARRIAAEPPASSVLDSESRALWGDRFARSPGAKQRP